MTNFMRRWTFKVYAPGMSESDMRSLLPLVETYKVDRQIDDAIKIANRLIDYSGGCIVSVCDDGTESRETPEKMCLDAQSIDPCRPEPYVLLCIINNGCQFRLRNGDVMTGEQACKRAIDLGSTDYRAYFWLGVYMNGTVDLPFMQNASPLMCLAKAIELNPKDERVFQVFREKRDLLKYQ